MALLFDMDGLLLDTERQYRAAFFACTEAFGVARDSDNAFFLSLVGASGTETQARLEAYLPDDIDMGAFYEAIYAEMRTLTATGIDLRPHVREVVPALAASGHHMAVVTSTRKAIALEKLEKTGLLKHFLHVTGGDEVSANKPDPAPYLETAARLGVPASECYAFEDSDRGIAAAVAAGCISTQIPDLRPPDDPLPILGQRVATDLRSAVEQLGLL